MLSMGSGMNESWPSYTVKFSFLFFFVVVGRYIEVPEMCVFGLCALCDLKRSLSVITSSLYVHASCMGNTEHSLGYW